MIISPLHNQETSGFSEVKIMVYDNFPAVLKHVLSFEAFDLLKKEVVLNNRAFIQEYARQIASLIEVKIPLQTILRLEEGSRRLLVTRSEYVIAYINWAGPLTIDMFCTMDSNSLELLLENSHNVLLLLELNNPNAARSPEELLMNRPRKPIAVLEELLQLNTHVRNYLFQYSHRLGIIGLHSLQHFRRLNLEQLDYIHRNLGEIALLRRKQFIHMDAIIDEIVKTGELALVEQEELSSSCTLL